MNKPRFRHTASFFFICCFFGVVASSWEVRHRIRFRRSTRPRKLGDRELLSTMDDFIKLKKCIDPYIENFQEKHRQFAGISRLWIINSANYWTDKYYRELKRRGISFDMSPLLMEEEVKTVKREIIYRIKRNGILYEINSLLGGFFGVYLEVRSLEFFLRWGRATKKPFIGMPLKKMFIWFSSYFTGTVVPCAGAIDEQRPVVLPYDHIYEMVKRAKIARLQPCSCKAFFLPENDIPRDSCMGFEYIEDLDDLAEEGYHGDFQMREHVLSKLRECEEKGLVHQFMTVSKPTGKKGYVLCNCEKSCIPVYIHTNYGIPMVRGCGLVVEITEAERCSGCGICVNRCHFNASVLIDGKAAMPRDKCLGCGLCIKTCPEKIRALKMPE